jgi:hypothetical protein
MFPKTKKEEKRKVLREAVGLEKWTSAIQLQPVFAQWIQNTHSLAHSATTSTSLTWGVFKS